MSLAGRLPALRDALWAYLGIAVLWTFAVAQPLFDLLKDNPEFFAARGSSGFDIISWSVVLVVVPPALLLAAELLIGLAGDEVRRVAHLVVIGGLVALIAVQALKKSIDASDTVLIVLSVAIGVGRGGAVRHAPIRCARSCACSRPCRWCSWRCSCSPTRSRSSPFRTRRTRGRSAGSTTRRSWWCCSTSCPRTR